MYLQNMESQFQDVQKNIILRAKKQPEDVYVPVHCDVYSTKYDVVKNQISTLVLSS